VKKCVAQKIRRDVLDRGVVLGRENVVSENKNDKYFGKKMKMTTTPVTDGVASFPLTKHGFLISFL
jgi:hypothetical protein